MATRILVPVDGSEQSWHALDFARGEFPEATLVLLHIINPMEAGYSAQATAFGRAEEWYERAQADAEDIFEEAREAAADHAGEIETVTELGRPSREIVNYVEDNDVDHVVMGSHGREGVSRILLGSVAETVVRRSPVPVTVVR